MCNTLTQQGASIDLVTTKNAFPPPAGGAITDGTYTATSAKVLVAQAPEGSKVITLGSITLQVAGNKIDVIATDTKGDQRRTGTYTTNGVDITLAETCAYPPSDAGPGGAATKYTATATTFTQYSTQNNTTVEIVYTKK
jgi:hypothetical protein